MPVDKEFLLKARLPEAEVEIPGVGTVRVRGLNRAEAMSVQNVKDGPGRTEAIERKMLALALLDPVLTEAEVGQWQKNSPAGELEPVSQKVSELSGMGESAPKDAYKEMASDPDVEFPVLPGSEVGDDEGTSPGGDVQR